MPDRTCPRRIRVQGRQIFAFARAAEAGDRVAAARLDRAFGTVARHGWAPDGAPGWVHRLAPDGTPLDTRRDSYDQAFMLFGLAAASRAGHPEAAALAAKGWAFIDTLAVPGSGGYLEGVPATRPRRSNPHMHLLEAALAAHEAAPDARHLARANAIATLFARHFVDRATGTLGEYFADDWSPLPPPPGDVVEPGHMFEWSWLLHRLAAAGGHDLRADAAALHERAHAQGRSADGFVVDETDRSGRHVRATRRLWPQTELVKSLSANGAREAARQVAGRLLETYLATRVAGLWIDQFDATGAPLSPLVPASTLYHLLLAWEELLGPG